MLPRNFIHDSSSLEPLVASESNNSFRTPIDGQVFQTSTSQRIFHSTSFHPHETDTLMADTIVEDISISQIRPNEASGKTASFHTQTNPSMTMAARTTNTTSVANVVAARVAPTHNTSGCTTGSVGGNVDDGNRPAAAAHLPIRYRKGSGHSGSPLCGNEDSDFPADSPPRIDEATRISAELLNDRIRTACSKLPKNISTGILLSTPSSRVLFASLSVGLGAAASGGAVGGGANEDRQATNPGAMLPVGKRVRIAPRQTKSQSQKKSQPTKISSALAPLLTEQLGFATQMGKAKKETVAGMKLAAENGLVFKSQLQDKEYVFLNASEFGEVEIVRELLNDPTLNVDCVDYMGRNAVLLAMKTENIELIDALVAKLNFYAVEDALLNAISQEKIHIVKLIVDHPQYIRMEKIMAPRGQRAGIINKCIERSQFSADITPLMLAAHTNNHEIIQLLLDRGLKVEMPHDRSCLCLDCESIRAQDSLILEMQRLHTYQALTSSAYLALTTSDPVSSAFTLRGELYQLASQEKQFKEEYSRLAVQSMDFAVSCLDLCRTSNEVHSLLTFNDIVLSGDTQYHLATIKHAVQCREKKFVAHSNCQHQLENTFYGDMFCIRDFEGWQRLQFFLFFTPALHFLYVLYLFLPNLKVAQLLRCPIIKFIGHMMSYFTFLLLITVATFRLDKDDNETEHPDLWKVRSFQIWSYDFRSSQQVMTKIQLLLLFWILGQLFGECKQVYHYGLSDYFRSYYNIMDWVSVALYLGAFALRIFVDIKVQATEAVFRQQLRYAQALLHNASDAIADNRASVFEMKLGTDQQNSYVAYRNNLLGAESAYWLRGCRLWWSPDDPEYVSDCLFALANVLSFARISYLMPAWELLGPLQISLARMVSDIIRFMTLFSVMLIAFVVGLTNLYWYFAKMIVSIDTTRDTTSSTPATVRYASGVPAFQSSTATFYTLFWALFGMSSNNVTVVEEELAGVYPGHEFLRVENSAFMITSLGSVLYAIYNACMIIILLNMLIAMMSKSFDEIQGDRLEEWKFARANLWLVYIEQEGVLPAPINLLPSRLAITKMARKCGRSLLNCRAVFAGRQKLRNCDSGEGDDGEDGDDSRNINDNNNANSSNGSGSDYRIKTGRSEFIPMSHVNSSKSDNLNKVGKQALPRRFDEPEAHLTRVKCNIMRRYLFQLQKQKEAENKSGDLAMLNIQRQQQQQEIRVTPLSPMDIQKELAIVKMGDSALPDGRLHHANVAQCSEGVDMRKVSDSGVAINNEGKDVEADCDSQEKQSAFSRSLAKSTKRGISSLLMPPSVRRKLEAVAEVQSNAGSSMSSPQDAEDTMRFLLLETTRRPNVAPEMFGNRTFDPGSYDSQFTARTERPIKDTHLRELYKVEQEMHDMSDNLSTVSFTDSTISEVEQLEISSFESMK